MNIERLTKLAELLENLDTKKTKKKFNMESWDCGTSACAVGHAMINSWFNKQGLMAAFATAIDGMRCVPTYNDGTQWDAVKKFFELDLMDAHYLFMDDCYPRKARPTTVAKRIRQFISEGGCREG